MQALPSFARQTGQPCGTCHTDFPALTPYGRRFKLLGYTTGGGELKLGEARARIKAAGRDIRLEIDGGVKVENCAGIAKAGADTFVAGSAIFGSADYARTIKAMRAQIESGGKSSA